MFLKMHTYLNDIPLRFYLSFYYCYHNATNVISHIVLRCRKTSLLDRSYFICTYLSSVYYFPHLLQCDKIKNRLGINYFQAKLINATIVSD